MSKDLSYIKSKIATVPDFPKEGIIFRDIFPIFQDPLAVEYLINHLINHIITTNEQKIDVIVGLDARGFLLGPILALRLNASFVPVRKRGKLCGEVISAEYVKEYGVDTFEMQKEAIKKGQNVIIIDDLIATGGSAFAAGELVSKNGGNLIEYLFIIELLELNGKEKLNNKVYSCIQY
ncbi:adenine phosphoribosyltransferase [Neoconidiobolus thromboides FSU 785]|nr:adenine phosphoribosyltransferase [Neoconidiobolus thromboides FSU 785]